MSRVCTWTGMLSCLLAFVTSVQAQERNDRYDFVLRDVQAGARDEAAHLPAKPKHFPTPTEIAPAVQGTIVQVTAVEPNLQSVVYYAQPDAATILPQLSETPMTNSFTYSESFGGKFMFSSAFERWNSPPHGDFSSVPDSTGMCDEWQTFCECENCCRDLGLNPWSLRKPRPNCTKCDRKHCKTCK